MSLVAYDNSDESSEEEIEVQTNLPIKVNKEEIPYENSATSKNLFSSLPAPKKINGVKDTAIKITIPALSDFKDDEDDSAPPVKKLKPSSKGSGLFSLLPPPKNTATKETKRALVPNSLVKKPLPPPVPVKAKLISSHYTTNSDPESDEESSVDFLGLNSAPPVIDHKEPDIHTPIVTQSIEDSILPEVPTPLETKETPCYPITGDFVPLKLEENLSLDEEAMQKLVGRRRNRDKLPIDLIDVSGSEIMPDSKDWMVKQLTEEKPSKSHNHRKKDGPSTVQKRKHQITYLAYQAKEQEQELQNQWANNRLSKKQTQSKYGF